MSVCLSVCRSGCVCVSVFSLSATCCELRVLATPRPISLSLLAVERRSHHVRALARRVGALQEAARQAGARPLALHPAAARPNTSRSPRRSYSGVPGRGGVARAAPSINRGGPPVQLQPMGGWALRAADAASVTRCHAFLPLVSRPARARAASDPCRASRSCSRLVSRAYFRLELASRATRARSGFAARASSSLRRTP